MIQARESAVAAWLYASGPVTRRQRRCYFALHEMAERSRYTVRAAWPLYTVEKLSRLVGGQGSKSALEGLRDELGRLAELGLARAEQHRLTFSRDLDALMSSLEGYRHAVGKGSALLRLVPVPRRLLRALAAGLGRADTLYFVATVLRANLPVSSKAAGGRQVTS